MLKRKLPLGGSTTVGDIRVVARATNPKAPPEKRQFRIFAIRDDDSELELEPAHDGHNSTKFLRVGSTWLRLESVQVAKKMAVISYKLQTEPSKRERARSRRRLAQRRVQEQ